MKCREGREVGEQAVFHEERGGRGHVDALAAGGQQGDDHQVAKRHDEAGGHDAQGFSAIAHDASDRAGDCEDRHGLRHVYRAGVVVRGVEHPDFAAARDGGERRR